MLTSEQKVQQYTARWKGVHHRIDKSLEEIKASLEGDAIDSLEVLKVKEDQLVQVNENFKESASLVDLIISEDPKQTNELIESEDAKSLQAASMIRACERQLARFRAAINASKMSSTEAAASAITESLAASSMRLAPTGPRFERRPLPTFKSGELRDYPTFKSDWVEAVDGYFKPFRGATRHQGLRTGGNQARY